MCGKWSFIGSALIVAVAVAALPLHGQRGQGPRGPRAGGQRGPNLGHSLELALENQEDLGIGREQEAQLLELKSVLDGEIAGLVEEMTRLQESFHAGTLERNAAIRETQAARGKLITAAAPLRGRIQEILTVEQHNKLQLLARRARPGIVRAGPRIGGAGPGIGGARAIRGGLAPGARARINRRARPAPFFRRGQRGGNLAPLGGEVNLP